MLRPERARLLGGEAQSAAPHLDESPLARRRASGSGGSARSRYDLGLRREPLDQEDGVPQGTGGDDVVVVQHEDRGLGLLREQHRDLADDIDRSGRRAAFCDRPAPSVESATAPAQR